MLGKSKGQWQDYQVCLPWPSTKSATILEQSDPMKFQKSGHQAMRDLIILYLRPHQKNIIYNPVANGSTGHWFVWRWRKKPNQHGQAERLAPRVARQVGGSICSNLLGRINCISGCPFCVLMPGWEMLEPNRGVNMWWETRLSESNYKWVYWWTIFPFSLVRSSLLLVLFHFVGHIILIHFACVTCPACWYYV